MNGLLLDTHILLRAASSGLSTPLLARLKSETNLVASTVSLWEIAIKVGLGKLQLDMSVEELIGSYLSRSGMERSPSHPRRSLPTHLCHFPNRTIEIRSIECS